MILVICSALAALEPDAKLEPSSASIIWPYIIHKNFLITKKAQSLSVRQIIVCVYNMPCSNEVILLCILALRISSQIRNSLPEPLHRLIVRSLWQEFKINSVGIAETRAQRRKIKVLRTVGTIE